MEGVGFQDTCGAPAVHDYRIREGEGEGLVFSSDWLLLKFTFWVHYDSALRVHYANIAHASTIRA